MKSNKMEQVAKLFSLALDEPFKIRGMNDTWAITKKGLENANGICYPTTLKNLLVGETEIERHSSLSSYEKHFLENVLSPFKERVLSITKSRSDEEHCYIVIVVRSISSSCYDSEEIPFPVFKKDSMYLGLKEEQGYTLEELGLFE